MHPSSPVELTEFWKKAEETHPKIPDTYHWKWKCCWSKHEIVGERDEWKYAKCVGCPHERCRRCRLVLGLGTSFLNKRLNLKLEESARQKQQQEVRDTLAKRYLAHDRLIENQKVEEKQYWDFDIEGTEVWREGS